MQQSQAVVQIEGAEDDCCMFTEVVVVHRCSLSKNYKFCLLSLFAISLIGQVRRLNEQHAHVDLGECCYLTMVEIRPVAARDIHGRRNFCAHQYLF